MEEQKKKLKLNLACGFKYIESDKEFDVVNIDYNPSLKTDVVHNIKYGLPYNNEWADEINCEHYVEHLDGEEFIRFFNECWRVLKLNGVLRITAPYYKGKLAFIDPTHKKMIHENSFNFFFYKDYNSVGAGVTGWYEPISVLVEKNLLGIEVILKKTLVPEEWYEKIDKHKKEEGKKT